MIQIGTADYQSTPIVAARTNLGTVYRSEPLITNAAKASLGTDPIECPDCGHPISDHYSSGCYSTWPEDTVPVCLCQLSPDDIGAKIEDDQEGSNQ